jgi:hypothetical protein
MQSTPQHSQLPIDGNNPHIFAAHPDVLGNQGLIDPVQACLAQRLPLKQAFQPI